MVVTGIERQKHRPRRVNVWIDGEFAIGLHEDVLFKFGLRKGDNVDNATLESIKSAEEFHLAREKALKFMAHRLRSEKELRTKLREKEFHPNAITETINYLRERRVVDDRAFAYAFVRDLLMKKPAGKIFLRRQLTLKGVEPGIIQAVLGELVSTSDEQALATETASKLLNRYLRSRKKVDVEKQRVRIGSFLARRGFEWSTISSVLHKLFADLPGRRTNKPETRSYEQ